VPIVSAEVVPGAVAMLDVTVLMADARAQYDKTAGTFRDGPFVCVQVVGDSSLWVAITSQKDKRGLRLEIQQGWRLEGSPVWQNTPQYVNDARKPFVGPVATFVSAGQTELPHQPHKRPHVSPAGIAAILQEIKKYGAATL
jgi:hypothetical protein